MPENLPKAVLILLWLLIGVIVFGYLLMASSIINSLLFAVGYYAIPSAIYRFMLKKSAD